VHYCDYIHRRSDSILARVWRRHDLNPTSWRAWRELKGYDLVIVKDMLALTPALVCRLQGRRCLFLDCFQQVHEWQLPLLRTVADRLVVFSQYQSELWTRKLNSPLVKAIPFGIDARFFQVKERRGPPDLFMCVGTDKRKDYRLFAEAAAQSPLRSVVVTSSRRVAAEVRGYGLELLRKMSYPELRLLYGRSIVVVPVLPNTDYPSGLTVLLEALIAGAPVIVARTQILEEYVSKEMGVLFYEPGNRMDLVEKMRFAAADWQRHDAQASSALVQTRYSHERMDEAITGIVESNSV
jgi:glycosyltransferase involved in cell wall biosynthesis